jgi:hypothetical protein
MARIEFSLSELPGPKGRYTEAMTALVEAQREGKGIRVPKDAGMNVQSAAVKAHGKLYNVHGQQSEDGTYRTIWLTKKEQ